MNIAIGGAGISGIMSAYYLKKKYPQAKITLFERSDRTGGHCRSEWNGDFLFEYGPQFIHGLDSDFMQLISDLQLNDQILIRENNERLIYQKNKFKLIPNNKFQFFFNGTYKHPFHYFINDFKAKPVDIYDSLKSFSIKHFGKQNTYGLIEPMLNAKFGGDINLLSTNAVFPFIKQLEREKGKIFTELFNILFQNQCISFREGLDSLSDRIVQNCDINVLYNQQIKSIQQVNQEVMMHVNDVAYRFDKLVLTTPSFVAAHLLKDCDEEFYKALGLIKYTPLVVVNMSFDYDCIRKKGMGYVIPYSEHQKILSVFWRHNVFPEHSTQQHANLSLLMSGSENQIIEKDVQQYIKTVLGHLRFALNIKTDPTLIKLRQYSRALPLYYMGIEKVWARLDVVRSQYKHIRVLGNYQNGIGIAETIRNIRTQINKMDF